MQPIRIKFNGDLEMEAWQADIVSGKQEGYLNSISELRWVIQDFLLSQA